MNASAGTSPPDVDPRLLTEAFRRARERADYAHINSDLLICAIVDEARRGARDLYTLVKAAGAAGPASAPREEFAA